MLENNEKIVFVVTHFEDNPEKAIIPFVLANACFAMDIQPVMILQSEGVRIAVKGEAEKIVHPPFDPLKKLVDNYISMGGKLLICSPCVKARNIKEEDLLPNSIIMGAATVLEEISSASKVLTY